MLVSFIIDSITNISRFYSAMDKKCPATQSLHCFASQKTSI